MADEDVQARLERSAGKPLPHFVTDMTREELIETIKYLAKRVAHEEARSLFSYSGSPAGSIWIR